MLMQQQSIHPFCPGSQGSLKKVGMADALCPEGTVLTSHGKHKTTNTGMDTIS